MNIPELIQAANVDHERMVLSAALMARRVPIDVQPEYFTGQQRRLYDAMKAQWDTHGEVQPELLDEQLRLVATDCLNAVGNASRQVVDSLRTEYLRRSHGLMMYESMKADTPEEGLRQLQEYIAQALFSHTGKDYDHRAELRKLIDALERAATERTEYTGFTTGIRQYDMLTNGLERGKVYVIGALKKTGKSRYMVHMAINAAQAGAGVIINSLEMSPLRLNHLALSHMAGVSSSEMQRAMSQEKYAKVMSGMSALDTLGWRIYSDGNVADMRSRIIYARSRGAVDVVFVDFIQRLHDDRYRRDRVREVERVSQDLADLAREQQVAMVELTQLRGEAEQIDKKRGGAFTKGFGKDEETEEDKMPDMSYVKESQGISENADVITILHNPKRHENPYQLDGSYRYPTFLCKVEQRDDVSGTVLRLRADLRTCRFSFEGDTVH